jgi:glycosyltransferase involved in cell wall biosynthesis
MINFSVLISVYKKERPEYLKESLQSIFSQTLLANEIILVEDGPLTEDLDFIIHEFEQKESTLKIIKLPQNVGLGSALNEGLKYCSYDYVARMDSDDICFPERFERQINYLKNHPDIDVIGCWTKEFHLDNQGNKIITSLKRFPHTVWENIKYCTKRCPVEHPAVIFKKKAVLAAGGYQHCYLFEDYHLWARMFVNGCKFYNIQEPLLFFRMSNESFIRRGGYKYAVNEYNALKTFRDIGFLTSKEFYFAVLTRFPVRIMPNSIRKLIYTKFLRKQ